MLYLADTFLRMFSDFFTQEFGFYLVCDFVIAVIVCIIFKIWNRK